MKKVLIVEDEREHQERYRMALNGKVLIISAYTIDEAIAQFNSNPDLDAIVMDACVPGDDPTTPPVVKKFRETFSGPMIAASGAWEYRQDLLAAGCDHEASKGRVPGKVLEVLGIYN